MISTRIKRQLMSSHCLSLSGNIPWWCLFFLSAGLVIIALIAQEVFNYLPCVMCIYQRTSFMAITVISAVALTTNIIWVRTVLACGVIIAALVGITLSLEHIDILTSPMGAFIPCDIEPNFPSLLPLHQWLPILFAAPGSCLDNRFQLFTLGMPQWALVWFVIFALFTLALLARFIAVSLRR